MTRNAGSSEEALARDPRQSTAAPVRRRCAAGLLVLAAAALATACSNSASVNDRAASPPNVVVILADDLGYSDIGAFGSEISTPNLDRLAREGRVLTNFHVTPLCATSRAELLTGVDHHLVNVGNLPEQSLLYPPNNPTYEGVLSHGAPTVAQLLLAAGYHTYMAGKWHVGGGGPVQFGFEQSFSLDYGAGNGVNFAQGAKPYFENGAQVPIPADFFSSDYFVSKLVQYIGQDRADKKPFFAYLAFQAPHYPLQAPDAYLKQYAGRYDAGYEAIRAARLEKQKRLGLMAQDFVPNPGTEAPLIRFGQPGVATNTAWDRLSPADQRSEARVMEVFAGMVTNLDDNVGRLLAYLEQIGAYDNTFIVFISDNGADGVGGIAPLGADNSLENYGRPGSFIFRSARWAEVGTTPLRLFKAFTAEGGISVPAIVRLPGGSSALAPSAALSSLRDVVPTILAAAGAPAPGGEFQGQAVAVIEGRSLLPVVDGSQNEVHGVDEVIADEVSDMRYVRRGPWKLSRFANYVVAQTLERDWQLYNMDRDRGETTDLAAAHPEIVSMLQDDWRAYVSRVGVAQPLLPFLPPIDQ